MLSTAYKLTVMLICVFSASKAAINFKDHKDGSCYVTYKVAEAGKLRKWPLRVAVGFVGTVCPKTRTFFD